MNKKCKKTRSLPFSQFVKMWRNNDNWRCRDELSLLTTSPSVLTTSWMRMMTAPQWTEYSGLRRRRGGKVSPSSDRSSFNIPISASFSWGFCFSFWNIQTIWTLVYLCILRDLNPIHPKLLPSPGFKPSASSTQAFSSSGIRTLVYLSFCLLWDLHPWASCS